MPKKDPSQNIGSHIPQANEFSWGVCPNKSKPIDDSLPTFSWDMLMRDLNRHGIDADNNAVFAFLVCGELYPGKYSAMQQIMSYSRITHAMHLKQEETGALSFAPLIRDKANTPWFVWKTFSSTEEPVHLTGYVIRKVTL